MIGVAQLRLGSVAELPLERMTLEQAERYLVQRAMAEAGGDVELAAKRLGLSRSAFYRRLSQLRT